MTKYNQYRLAKRKGEITQQYRVVTSTTKHAYPLWKIWRWGTYVVDYEYGEWIDMPMEEIE